METSAARARLRICLGIHRGVFQGFMVSDPAIYRRDGRARATATSSTQRCPATGTQGLGTDWSTDRTRASVSCASARRPLVIRRPGVALVWTSAPL